jgi:hypothetical protein
LNTQWNFHIKSFNYFIFLFASLPLDLVSI